MRNARMHAQYIFNIILIIINDIDRDIYVYQKIKEWINIRDRDRAIDIYRDREFAKL